MYEYTYTPNYNFAYFIIYIYLQLVEFVFHLCQSMYSFRSVNILYLFFKIKFAIAIQI